MSPINAGDLDAELTLQRPNGEDGSWADVETIWAQVRMASTNESLRFGQALSSTVYVVTIYFRDDIQGSWRLVNQNTSPQVSWQIRGYGDPDGAGEQLRVYCVRQN